jgi:3-deoxy-manno-octulosonate cytidylyltransferase (CMP-KDO synthetase)
VVHHGEIPEQNIVAIIPARYASTRLPGKMMCDIAGEPLILHTLRRVAKARLVKRTIVATDDRRIFDVAVANGFEAAMTSELHISGSDRIAEVAHSLPEATVIVNVQGDEPTISPDTIDRAVGAMLTDSRADIVTISEDIASAVDIQNPNIVKVVTDRHGYALYFSRSPIPFPRNEVSKQGDWDHLNTADPSVLRVFRKHTGLYVYRREFLMAFSQMTPTDLEKVEMLEQLRALENGAVIKVVEAAGSSIGVDTFDDLERVRRLMANEAAV